MLTFTDLTPAGSTTPPSLSFDFTTRVNRVGLKKTPFADALTFTRASPKWVFDGTGTLVEVPVDQPAYDHDPVTGESLGVLIEESRTNLFTYSEQFDNAAWGTFKAIVTANASPSPDGENTADKVAANTESNYHGVRRIIPTGTTGLKTVSCFFKAAEYSVAWICDSAYATFNASFDLVNLTTPQVQDTSRVGVVSSEAVDIGNGWVRCSVVLDVTKVDVNCMAAFAGAPSATSGFAGGAHYQGDGTSGIYIWGAQIEQASTASSYIPTTTAAVTRAVDNMSRTLGAEFNPSAGTFLLELSETLVVDSTKDVLTILTQTSTGGASGVDVGFSDFNTSYGVGPDRIGFISKGVSWSSTVPTVPDTALKMAGSYDVSSGTLRMSGDGAPASEMTGVSLVENNIEPIVFNARGGLFIRGAKLTYYPYAMTAAELAALTAP